MANLAEVQDKAAELSTEEKVQEFVVLHQKMKEEFETLKFNLQNYSKPNDPQSNTYQSL